ncbi:MAG TPA: DUF5908 family protein [Chitinophagaceae bacterium]
MPVQINELVIRAHIKEPGDQKTDAPSSTEVADKEEIIKECLERVMELLQEQKER